MSGKVSWQARFESARSNRLFELFIILVIIASALLIGVKTYQLAYLGQTALRWS